MGSHSSSSLPFSLPVPGSVRTEGLGADPSGWPPQQRLHALVEVFTGTDPCGEPVAIGIRWFDTEVELTAIPLWGGDPIERLATVEADPGWDAFGVVTRGTATSLRPDDDLRERVQVAVLVDRSGHIASAVRTLDGDMICDGHIDLTEGRVPDACRRVLGLSTGPPPAEPFSLLALQWADALAVLGAACPGTLTWREALAARPFDPRSTWTELRLGVASDALHVPGITSEMAAFMDDGMFAREAVACSPSPRHLFEVLSATVPGDVLQRLVDHLDDLADRLDLW